MGISSTDTEEFSVFLFTEYLKRYWRTPNPLERRKENEGCSFILAICLIAFSRGLTMDMLLLCDKSLIFTDQISIKSVAL